MARHLSARLLIAGTLLTGTLLSGCVPAPDASPYMRLIDRRAFEPPSAPVTGAPLALPRRALVVISYDSPSDPPMAALDAAVDAAYARKQDVSFDILAAIRPGGQPDAAIQRHAIALAHEIAERGISPTRIHVGIAQDQGASPRELRIYVQ
ncbi:MAG: hypothetical protein P4L66_01580 [Acetobacteraceae bacterium]|nr:hypothetical protein [Acetobacteraceae bacterium]